MSVQGIYMPQTGVMPRGVRARAQGVLGGCQMLAKQDTFRGTEFHTNIITYVSCIMNDEFPESTHLIGVFLASV